MQHPDDQEPTRVSALLFWLKAWVFRMQRTVRNTLPQAPRRLRRAPLQPGSHEPLSESRSLLFTSSSPAEFSLQAGKVQNLRVAARSLNGLLLPANEEFSFWRNVGRPSAMRGFAPGRELREGCIVPSTGGGLCQLSNALYDAALSAGCEIVERHAHSRTVPGSMAEAERDATVFWNYVDLRFRPPVDCQLEVELCRGELLVRFRPTVDAPPHRNRRYTAPPTPLDRKASVESCETCGVTECFRNPRTLSLPKRSETAWLVDAWWPEFADYLRKERSTEDSLFIPLKSRTYRVGRYFWETAGFRHVHQSRLLTLWRSLASRRLKAQGAARQQALLRFDQELAWSYGKRIPYAALHVVVSQNLLPYLWLGGYLAGRTYDVLMTRLPMRALEQRLDQAAKRWPESKTLADFRADPVIVAAEEAALAEARHWITPHAEIAALGAGHAVHLDWHSPSHQPHRSGSRILFPSSTLARKGALELRIATRELGLPVSLMGPVLEEPGFWNGCDIRHVPADCWDDVRAVVSPAWVEHQPRRLLEAAARGFPVVASKACGLAGVANVTTIPTGDVAALIAELRALLAMDSANSSPTTAVAAAISPAG